MKKTILRVTLIIILVLSMVIPAYAAEPWVLSPDTKMITHGDDVYYPIEFKYSNFISYTNPELGWASYSLEFANKKMASTYADSNIYVTFGIEHIAVEAQIVENHEIYKNLIYVEEAYYDEFLKLKNGMPTEYVVSGNYADWISVSINEFDTWCESSTVTIDADDVYNQHYSYIYATDNQNMVVHEVGMILMDTFTEEIYLLRYDDYGASCFDELGTFIPEVLETVTVHALEDTSLETRLRDDFFAYQTDVAYGEVSSVVAGVFATILFGIVPLAVMIFAVVMLIKVKDKKYRRGFAVMITGTAVLLAAFAAVFIIAA